MDRQRMVLFGLVAGILVLPDSASSAGPIRLFTARMSGGQEIPPRVTPATGLAVFELNQAETQLTFKVEVKNITNVFASHIHLGSPKVNGPILVGLFGAAPGGGPINGVLAQGTITRGGTLSEAAFDSLIAQMRAGNTYVNVHTNDGVAPPNTGPGDFPGGEIRGQVSPGPTSR